MWFLWNPRTRRGEVQVSMYKLHWHISGVNLMTLGTCTFLSFSFCVMIMGPLPKMCATALLVVGVKHIHNNEARDESGDTNSSCWECAYSLLCAVWGYIHLVMSTIPSHYSKAFVHQRFRKALSIVQHHSSTLEPTKDQRLEVHYTLFSLLSCVIHWRWDNSCMHFSSKLPLETWIVNDLAYLTLWDEPNGKQGLHWNAPWAYRAIYTGTPGSSLKALVH